MMYSTISSSFFKVFSTAILNDMSMFFKSIAPFPQLCYAFQFYSWCASVRALFFCLQYRYEIVFHRDYILSFF